MSIMGNVASGLMIRMAVGGAAVGGVAGVQSGAIPMPGGLSGGLPIPGMAAPQPAFHQVSARVTSVEQACRLMLVQGATARRTDVMSCSQAEMLLETANFKDYERLDTMAVEYSYYSPDGTEVLTNREESVLQSGGRAPGVGDVIRIQMSSSDPSDTKRI